jgi:high affinity Mn2+ porin
VRANLFIRGVGIRILPSQIAGSPRRTARAKVRAPINGRHAARFGFLFAAVAIARLPIAPPLGAQVAPQTPIDLAANTGPVWNGWSVGGQIGYSQGNATAVVSAPAPTESSKAFGRLDGGLHAGYNDVRASRLVFGAEGDIAFPAFFEDGAVSSGTVVGASTVSEKIDFVSTLRGRLGYILDRWLLYGTGGVGLSQTRLIDSAGSINDQEKVDRPGWTLGAGAEFAFAPGWTARVEYRYDQLGVASTTFPPGIAAKLRSDLHALRLGFSRSLSWRHAGGPAREPGSPAAVERSRWNIHAQDTYVEQGYAAFRSPYEGANSLSGASQVKNTVSSTVFVDSRLWAGADLYFDPEIDQGFGLNDTHGVAAFPNGEAQKASFPAPRLVIDRLVIRQTFDLGGTQTIVKDGTNQLAGTSDISRVTLVMGRLAVTDYFDDNTYANDPRTNFLNWNTYGAGAYDWTMDELSWTWGALADLNQKDWAFRVGYFLLPTVSSTNTYDTHIPERGEYAAEFEWRYALSSQPGKLRLFGWVNHGTMGGYAAALALPPTTPNYPDIALTRQVRTNPGVVLNAEQAITGDLGLFSRASWSPGRVEILGGTDCSESWSLGGVLKGKSWGRPNDNIGVAGVVGGLSPVARAYFAAGGLGILIGDGALDYRAEQALEGYYAYAVEKWATLSFDYQFVVNPAYNADRGPVSIYAVRIHTAF